MLLSLSMNKVIVLYVIHFVEALQIQSFRILVRETLPLSLCSDTSDVFFNVLLHLFYFAAV